MKSGMTCSAFSFTITNIFTSPKGFAFLVFLEAVQASSHVKLGRPAFVIWFNSLKQQLKHFVWDFYLPGVFMQRPLF